MSSINRRDLFRSLIGRSRKSPPVESPDPAKSLNTANTAGEEVALILDRFCLAYQGSFCSVCLEHCPEPGAILITQGKPHIETDACTGCKKCQEVCPAPKKAVFLVARKPKQGMIARNPQATEED